MSLQKLFSPIKVGTLELKNRIVMLPMGTATAAVDGNPSDSLIDYYAARARGGAGLIIVEITIAHVTSRAPSVLALYDDAFIPQWKKLADAVHAHGARIFPQLAHQGRQVRSAVTGHPVVAASAIPCPLMKEMPRELTKEGIDDIIEGFGEAARRAQDAGCDGVEIHGAHGYLVCNFMSPLTNKRTDEYGATLSGRMRFPLEIIARIREKCAHDFPISFRISSDEMLPGGIVPEEAKVMAAMLARAGVDIISVSRGNYGSFRWLIPPYGTPPAVNAEFTGRLKQILNIPVLLGHRIGDPIIAEQLLEEGKTDLVGMGRALLADPDLPRKAAEGRDDDIIPCIGCNQGCLGRLMIQRTTATCMINPTAGREREFLLIPAEREKRVLVIGGGVAGMECARVAAQRGHDVTLIEKTDKLGGQFRLACIPPMKQEFTKAIRYFSTSMVKAGVKIEMGLEVTPELAKKLRPDAVVVATGAVPLLPANIPGTDKPIVITAHDLLAGKAVISSKVVIIGGGLVGCEVAEYAAERGTADITVLEMLKDVALDMVPFWNRIFLLERLADYKVKIVTSAEAKVILDDAVVYTRDGIDQYIRGVTNVVLAAGSKPVNDLYEKLRGTVAELYIVGDAKAPRMALEAIEEGTRVARQI